MEQEAYNEGLSYAKERMQFGKKIISFPAVYDMLSRMKAKLDAGRSLLYQTARYVDLYKALENIGRDRKLTPEERLELKKWNRLADASRRWPRAPTPSGPTRTPTTPSPSTEVRASSWSISRSASSATRVSSLSMRVRPSCR